MARIFQRNRKWWLDYIDAQGNRVREKASTDKSVASHMLGERLKQIEKMRSGMIVHDPRELKRAIEGHFDEYKRELERNRRDARYIYGVDTRLRKIARIQKWKTLGDISPRSIGAYLDTLAAAELTPKTINEARSDLSSFLNWCVRQGRMGANPCASVSRVADEREKTRRALSVPELTRLLEATPERRKLVYLFLIYTGLRRSEAARITWSHVRLDGLNPRVELSADMTKSGKAESVPLVPVLAAALLDARGEPEPGTRVFWAIPQPATFRRDLAKAGIPVKDERGREVVLHSLRHSLATMLAASQVPMAIAQRIMRHRDIRLTAEVYTDEGLLPLAAAMRSLPSIVPVLPSNPFAPQSAKATGTDHLHAGTPVPDFVPFGGHKPARTGISASGVVPGEHAQGPVKAVLGTIRHAEKNCGRQESNLHGLSATGT